jgi:hypothetical protein
MVISTRHDGSSAFRSRSAHDGFASVNDRDNGRPADVEISARRLRTAKAGGWIGYAQLESKGIEGFINECTEQDTQERKTGVSSD